MVQQNGSEEAWGILTVRGSVSFCKAYTHNRVHEIMEGKVRLFPGPTTLQQPRDSDTYHYKCGEIRKSGASQVPQVKR